MIKYMIFLCGYFSNQFKKNLKLLLKNVIKNMTNLNKLTEKVFKLSWFEVGLIVIEVWPMIAISDQPLFFNFLYRSF